MYPTGHTGINLIIYSPVASVLLYFNKTKLVFVGLLIMLVGSKLPDKDQSWKDKFYIPFINSHRGFTHTIWFALIISIPALLIGYLSNEIGTSNRLANSLFLFSISYLSIISHLIGDVITVSGVNLFYPLKKQEYDKYNYNNPSLSITKAKSKIHNILYLIIGTIFLIMSMIPLAIKQGKLNQIINKLTIIIGDIL